MNNRLLKKLIAQPVQSLLHVSSKFIGYLLFSHLQTKVMHLHILVFMYTNETHLSSSIGNGYVCINLNFFFKYYFPEVRLQMVSDGQV